MPANELSAHCYDNMFNGCTSLSATPALPATGLASDCYYGMFGNCTSLTNVSELSALDLSERCYYRMFQNCTSLSAAPELPATGLASSCYYQMFNGCTELTGISILPATELIERCYYRMFEGCTSLSSAPILPATQLVSYCYYGMLSGCTSLNYINVKFNEWTPSNATTNWLKGVSTSGIFVCPSNLSAKFENNFIPNTWLVNPLTFTALIDNSSIDLIKGGSNNTIDLSNLKINKNNTEWVPFIEQIDLNSGDTVSFINMNNTLGTSSSNYLQFKMIGEIQANGNVQSLLNYSNSVPNYGFYKLFNDCETLKTMPELPAETVNLYSYSEMFKNCINLTEITEIGVNTIGGNGALLGMFQRLLFSNFRSIYFTSNFIKN